MFLKRLKVLYLVKEKVLLLHGCLKDFKDLIGFKLYVEMNWTNFLWNNPFYLGSENDQNTGNSHFKLQGEKETSRPFTSLKTKVAFNKTMK